MMENIEKQIIEKREAINNEFTPEGHLERFEMKLQKKKTSRSGYWIGFLSGIAAVLIIGFLFLVPTRKQTKNEMTLSLVSNQYAEVEFFYTSSISHQLSQLDQIGKNIDEKTIEMIKKELTDYDQTYTQLAKELKASPNDERVISAMINYYRTKLEMINRILFELENKRSNSNNYENTSI